MTRKFIKVIASILAISIFACSSAIAETGTVTGSKVKIRKEPSTEAPEITIAVKGEKVEILSEENGWYKINFGKIEGYISKEYVSSESSASANSTAEPAKEPEANTQDQTTDASGTVAQDNVEASAVQPENTANQINDTTQLQNPENIDTSVGQSNSSNSTKKYEENKTITLEFDVSMKNLPNFASRQKAVATKDSTYTIKAVLNNWIKISNETGSGWVLKTSLENGSANAPIVSEEDTSQNQPENVTSPEVVEEKGKVNVDSARARKAPDGEILESLPNGTEVIILGEEGDWYKIKTEKNEECYIAKRLITKN